MLAANGEEQRWRKATFQKFPSSVLCPTNESVSVTASQGLSRAESEGLLFPLRLSDFEYYMVTDDRPSHPMVFVMVVHVTGTLAEPSFRESVAELVDSHPLLKCRVEKVGRRDLFWVPVDAASNSIEWRQVDEATAIDSVPQVRSIDIRTQPGLQLQVFHAKERSQVVMYLHHACCDGIGALQLIGELFARYGQKTAAPDEKRPEFETTNAFVLLQRENYEAGESATQRQKKSLTRVVGKISRLLLRAPIMLASSRDFLRSGSSPASKPLQDATWAESSAAETSAIQSRLLSKSIHRSLRAVAAKDGVSVNDLFIREMILQVRDWNRSAGVSFGRRWIRLAIPLSMRTVVHENMPAANVVSYALVTRREQDCHDPAELLRSIHQQTSDVLFNREGIVCLKLFKVLRKIPGAMKAFLSLKTVLSTMVLANVGDVRRRFNGRFPLQKGRWIAGNVLIEQIHGVAPVRPNTRAAMSIGDYAGELSISLRTDGQMLNAGDSRRFLDEFLNRLTALIPATEADTRDED